MRNSKTINEIRDSFEKGKLVIDDSYQRRKVWISKDRVRLIETILLKLIIPEIFVWDYNVDPDTGNTVRHIVDGQQRIAAIIDFTIGKYKLTKKDLLDDTIKSNYADFHFKDLPDSVKQDFWNYNISIININKGYQREDIIKMFYRLNLTDYSLNHQEKRNSLSSKFGLASEQLSNDKFWQNHKIFSQVDLRRMRDVEFCSNILILAREGILDQANQKKINEVYADFAEDYAEKETDIARVKTAMKVISKLTNNDTFKFISKKSQMYTLFSLAFDMSDDNIEIEEIMIEKFTVFVIAYDSFSNKKELEFNSLELREIYENVKRYKLASSEGLNKLSNRMIRFEVLKKACILSDDSILESLNEIIKEFKK